MLRTKILRLLSILLIIGLIFGTMPTVFAEEDTTTTEENTESTADDGASDDGTADDGASDDGTADDGASDDGTADDGASDDGASDDGTTDDGIDDDTVAAGLTPDSILYVLDRLLENIQITLTIDDAKKTLLLMTISEERLAEAEYLIDLAQNDEVNEDEWNQLFQDVVDDYRDKVNKALEVTEELAYETDDDTKADLDEIIEKISTSVDFDREALNNNDQINEVKDNALLVANVVSDLDKDKVAEIRDLGVGYGQISQIFALSEVSEKDLDEIAALFTEEKMGLGQATKELGIKTSDFAKIKNSATVSTVEENDNENNDEDEDENNDVDNENNDTNENAVELNYANNNNGEESETQANNKVKADKGGEIGNKDNTIKDNSGNNSTIDNNSDGNKDKVKENKNDDTVDLKNDNSKTNKNSNNSNR